MPKESAVVLMDSRRIEYIDNPKQEIEEYYTIHKLVYINDDKGIESFNKIYLDVSDKADIVDVKARTILPNGKTLELNRDNIKDIKESNGNTYKIFAMEGLEKGCEVEFYYTIKKPVSYFGREIIQQAFPVVYADVRIISPQRLTFAVKTYNYSAQPVDTVTGSKRVADYPVIATPGAEEEKYADYVANLRRVEFKLSYNDVRGKGERLFTWNELAKRIYGIYTTASEKESSKVADLVTANGWDKLANEPAKIMAVENYVKKTFSYDENLESEEGNMVQGVLQNKIAGTIGLMRLYSALFKNLAIDFQYVLTCAREKYIIDRSFENWQNCDQPLFYFPAERNFIAPTRADFRYPWIVPGWGACNGLFCKQTVIGTFSTAIAEIKTVPLQDYTQSYDNIDSKLELSHNLDSLKVDGSLSFAGYLAAEYRGTLNFSSADDREKIIKELAKELTGVENTSFTEVTGQEFDNENSNVPLVIHAKNTSDGLIEHAGNKLLVKIGLAIGQQEEMYQEKPRQNPLSIEFGHFEERKITFIIPDGYTISNPNDLIMNQVLADNGETSSEFISGYQIKGNVLTVHIMEQYRKTSYPVSSFNDFRKIINASSDFNKVVLVLDKKS